MIEVEVKGPWHGGKSNFAHRIADLLRRDGYRVALHDEDRQYQEPRFAPDVVITVRRTD